MTRDKLLEIVLLTRMMKKRRRKTKSAKWEMTSSISTKDIKAEEMLIQVVADKDTLLPWRQR